MSSPRFIQAVTLTQTPATWSWHFAYYLPPAGSNTVITSACWRGTNLLASDLPPPGTYRALLTDVDIAGELCLVERVSFERILAEYSTSAASMAGEVSKEAKKITLGQWVKNISGPRVISTFGADDLHGFISDTGRCGTDAALVAWAVDETPAGTPRFDLSLAVRSGHGGQ